MEGSGIPISSLSLPTAKTAKRHLGDQKKSEVKQVHPGYSMFEWTKLCHSGKDMSGTGGRMLKVSPEELAAHSSDKDIWTSVRGVVYNVTEFARYHPGGKTQLMRGAGQDCTELFDKIHVWVNSEAILKECTVGVLTGKGQAKPVSLSNLVPGTTKPPFTSSSGGKLDHDEGTTVLTMSVPTVSLSNTTKPPFTSSSGGKLDREEGTTVLSMSVPTLSLKDAGSVEATPRPDVCADQLPVLIVPETKPGDSLSTRPPSSSASRSTEDLPDQISIQVPSRPAAELTSSNDFALPNIVALSTIVEVTSQSASNLQPTHSAKSSKSSSPHVFRTNIRGQYISNHPLISKTAFESEV